MALKTLRCAIYTRKSTSEGLEQDFNTLDAQRSACEAYVQSQTHEGWKLIPTLYDDGGFSGASMDRPALKALMCDIEAGYVDVVVVYKVDRLTRSLADFARLVDLFDNKDVSFVSVTQAFNTTNSMGRLTLNVLLSFAQFEREVTAERIRDKFRASKQKGMWMGGRVPLGYDAKDRKLVINRKEAEIIRTIFDRYLELRSVTKLQKELKDRRIYSKRRISKHGRQSGGGPFTNGALLAILQNPIYLGKIRHKETVYQGNHKLIIDQDVWDRVQNQLNHNRVRRHHQTNAKDPSLLAGLMFDGDNNQLYPRHTCKQSKRYRYYVNQAVSLPAYEIESLVTRELAGFIKSNACLDILLNQKETASLQTIEHARKAITKRIRSNPTRKDILTLVTKVVVSSDQTTLHISKTGIFQLFNCSNNRQTDKSASVNSGKDTRSQNPESETAHQAATTDIQPQTKNNPDLHVLNIQTRLKRSGNGKRLVIGPQSETATRQPDPALLKTIARAHLWFDELKRGKSFKEIALANNIDQRHVARTIRLAFLAPDITQSILQGYEPNKLNPVKLLRLPDLPIAWEEQRNLIEAL